MFKIPVSIGEIFDKLTILDIKRDRIEDPGRRAHVSHEYDLLYEVVSSEISKCSYFYRILKVINSEIWDSMNILRDNVENTEFWARECRKTLVDNDRRCRVKNKINTLINSAIKEQKSYKSTSYELPYVFDRATIMMAYPLIRYRSTEYDTISVVCSSSIEEDFYRDLFKDDPSICISMSNATPTTLTEEEIYSTVPISVKGTYARL